MAGGGDGPAQQVGETARFPGRSAEAGGKEEGGPFTPAQSWTLLSPGAETPAAPGASDGPPSASPGLRARFLPGLCGLRLTFSLPGFLVFVLPPRSR